MRVCKGADRLGWKLIPHPTQHLPCHVATHPLPFPHTTFLLFPFSFPMHLLVSYAASLHFTVLIPHFPSPFPLFSFTKLMFARTRGYISLVQWHYSNSLSCWHDVLHNIKKKPTTYFAHLYHNFIKILFIEQYTSCQRITSLWWKTDHSFCSSML